MAELESGMMDVTFQRGFPLLLLVTGLMLSGCAAPLKAVTGYEEPPQSQPVPTEYPNVYTSIRREDKLRSPEERDAEKADLIKARDTHVRATTKQIVN